MRLPCDVIILAAGRGKRLRGDIPKPLLPLAGQPLIMHVLNTITALKPRKVVVVTAPDANTLKTTVQSAYPSVTFVTQSSPRGTADAARCGAEVLANNGTALILCADTPLLTTATLRQLHKRGSGLALLIFQANNPLGYGRILRKNDSITAIVEAKDASAAVRKITEVFAGVLAAPTRWLKKTLPLIDDNNVAGERYLTSLVARAAAQQLPITTVTVNENEAAGVNTMTDLAATETILRMRRTAALMARGVRLIDAQRVDIRGTVYATAGATIDVNVILSGNVKLGRNCYIGAHSIITNCSVGANVVIEPFCHLNGARIGSHCRIGPYARIRPETVLANDVHVGNFVEVKNSHLAAGTKAGHLTYLGDSDIGRNTNIGAGVITCNFDGKHKHRTIIGDNAFIGSDVQLIAPVRVGKSAIVAAGTTLTHAAPAKRLTIARTPQQSRALSSRETKTTPAPKKNAHKARR